MDERELAPIVGKELVVDALGYWPSFHDAHVLAAARKGDHCEVLLYVFHMTDQVDERGYFVLTKHHHVRLSMKGVSECSLPADYDGDILFELLFKNSRAAVTVIFSSVTDKDWEVTCEEVEISDVAPCGPRGAAI